MAHTHEVIVVGAGPVGLAQALTLTRFAPGIRVALVDRRPIAAPSDLRASAIGAGVRRAFEALGVWEEMAAEAQAVSAMRLTDSGPGDLSRPGFLDFAGEVAPGEPFAHMVPNTVLNGALIAALGDGAERFAPARIEAVAFLETEGRLTLGSGTVLRAPLVIAADGARSPLREAAGIDTIEADYGQDGIVTTIAHELPHEGVAYEHFRPEGPFASLPLPGNRSSLVWSVGRAEAARLVALPAEALAREIEAAMGSCLGAVTLAAPVQSFPLKLLVARRFSAPRLALVGDAAHVIHPIAGQGLNLGLKDVAAIGQAAVEALRLGLDPGSEAVLARYDRWRALDTARMVVVTDGMNRLFSNDIAPLRALRDVGLGLVDRAGPVKEAMMRLASGLERDGPLLLSGRPI